MKHLWKLALCLALVCFALIFCAGSAALAEGVSYLDASGQTQTCETYTSLAADTPTAWDSGWYVAVPGTLELGSRVTVSGNVHLILCDGAALTVTGGINVSSGNSLTVYAQSTGTSKGALTVSGVAQYNAGIGGNNNENGGTVTINGGTVTVTGGQYGAGIGGGYGSDGGGIITINGGTVKAIGGDCATGIGGGGLGGGGTVTINGGNVEANSGIDWYNERIVGIGGGYNRDGGTLTVDFSSASDSLKASSYGGTVTVANHKVLTDGNGNGYTGGLSGYQKNAIAGKTLQPAYFVYQNITGPGTFASLPGAARPNSQVTFTLSPDAGCELKENSLSVTYTDGENHTQTVPLLPDENDPLQYTFTMPAYHVTVSAAFRLLYLDANGQSQICETYTSLTAAPPTAWGSGWYVAVPGTLKIGERVTVSGNVHLILRDGANLTVTGGINVSDGNSLTIYAQSTGSGTGELTVKGVAEFNAGIGGNDGESCGTVTINGGTVNVKSGDGGAGIGGGYGGAGGNITVNGGTIHATGGYDSAGIGGGYSGPGGTAIINNGTVIINGGTVTATGGENGAGIGSGYNGADGEITVNGGTVTATGGKYGAGIGGGYNSHGGTLTVGFSSASASLTASSYGGTVTVANGKILSFTDADSVTHYYAGELTNDEKSAIAGQTLQKNNAAYIIYKSVTGQGTVTSSASAALAETPVTLSAAPATGCVLMSLTYAYTPVGGTETIVPIDAAKDEETGIYTGSFTMPAAHVTVNAVFGGAVNLPDSIAHGSMSASAGGVPLAAGGLVPVGETVTLTLAPADGYLPDTLTYTYTPAGGEATTGTVTCAKDEDTGNYIGSFDMPAADVTVAASFAPDPACFSVNEAGTEYTIHTATGWDVFCDCMQDEDAWSCFSGKTVKLGASITVDRMVDSEKPFCGTFDGQGHTLTFNYSGSEDFIAPFPYTTWSTTPVFRNLTVSGTINTTGSYAAGFIGHLYGEVTIENCASNVDITSAGCSSGFVGLCEHTVHFTDCVSSAVIHSTGGNNSGFVGWSRASGHEISFSGCLFNGKLLQKDGSGGSNGGFIGWTGSNKTVTITNCLCAPAALASGETMADGNSATFARGWNETTTATDSYYITALGTAQGTQIYPIAPGEDVILSAATSYADGVVNHGGTLYAKEDASVSLTLSYAGTPADGYIHSGYTASAGTLDGTTLTMPASDVTVTATFVPIPFGMPDFTLPSALETIGEAAFEGLTEMSIVDAQNVTAIGKDAFKGCTGLTQIRLPKDCAIDPDAFSGCGTVYVYAPAGGPTEAYCGNHENLIFVDENEDVPLES